MLCVRLCDTVFRLTRSYDWDPFVVAGDIISSLVNTRESTDTALARSHNPDARLLQISRSSSTRWNQGARNVIYCNICIIIIIIIIIIMQFLTRHMSVKV